MNKTNQLHCHSLSNFLSLWEKHFWFRWGKRLKIKPSNCRKFSM